MEYDKGDVYNVFEEKSKPFDDNIASFEEAGLGEDFLLSLLMGSVGGGIKINSLSDVFKLAVISRSNKGLSPKLNGELRAKYQVDSHRHAEGFSVDASKNVPFFGVRILMVYIL